MDDAPVAAHAPVAPRLHVLHLGLALVLLAGQPAFLGAQVFSTGAILRGALLAVGIALALLAAWQGAVARPAVGPWRALLPFGLLGVGLLGLPPFDGDMATAARAGGTWALAPLLALALAWSWRGAADAAAGLRALVIAGVVAAACVLVDRITGHLAAGPFGRPGIAGPVLAALVAPALLLPTTPRAARLALALALAVGCLASGSRVAMVALPLGLLAALAAGLDDAPLRRRARIALVATAVVLAGLLALALEGVLPVPGSARTLEVRLGLARGSLAALEEAPLRGHGLGSYPSVALRHRDLDEARLEPGRRPYDAHDDYLHAGVEGGWPALLLLALTLGGAAWIALRARGADGPARALHGAAAGVVVTIAVSSLGEGVLLDPAPALVLGAALAALLVAGAPRRAAVGALAQAPLLLGALLALGIGYVLARDAVADAHLMRYRHALQGHATLAARTRAGAEAATHLTEGVLRWRPDHPEAHYRLGVLRASTLRYADARDAFREALRADPGMTDARLALAQVYRLEGRPHDAEAALEEAARRDPTRYDVPRQQAELLLGPEPVPGDAPRELDDIAILRRLNDARALAPDRFENLVDQARYQRRRAREPEDLALAGDALRQAMAAAPGDPANPPAEILLESFHLAEAEGQPLLVCATILMQALARNPAPAGRYRAQAERFLDEGDAREERALERAGDDPTLLDMRSAQRAYDAAAVRYTALLYTGLADPESVLAQARVEAEARRFRRALALYRSLLAWTLPPKDGASPEGLRGDERLATIARQGDLLLEAAKVAQRVDRPLSNFYRTQGKLRIGIELLEKGKADMARMHLQGAVEADAGLADGHFALARAHARLEEEPRAAKHLLEALRLKPSLARQALAAPDLQTLRRRADVKQALDIR